MASKNGGGMWIRRGVCIFSLVIQISSVRQSTCSQRALQASELRPAVNRWKMKIVRIFSLDFALGGDAGSRERTISS
jgi:hypothetical protein